MQIEYVYVDANTPTPDKYYNGFIRVYKEAFSLHPYYEVYTDSEVLNDVWVPHLNNGLIVLACDGELVVGLGCAKPLLKSPSDVQEFLRMRQLSKDSPIEFRNIEFSDAWYISELGVLLAYQNRGIGTQIMVKCLARILEHQFHYFVTRTAAKGSNSINIFRKLGAIELPEHQDVSDSKQIKDYKSQSTARIYFYGCCEEALRKIIKI